MISIAFCRKRIFLHPRRKPGTPKVAICEVCGKDFKENFRLREHMRVHTGTICIIRYSCNRDFGLKTTESYACISQYYNRGKAAKMSISRMSKMVCFKCQHVQAYEDP